MSEMIERVARKMAGQYMIDDGFGEDSRRGAEQGEMWKNFRASARAAIEAMREPTEAMIDAAYEHALDENAKGVWQDMIDAALTDKQP